MKNLNSDPSWTKETFEVGLCFRPIWEQDKLNLNIPRKKRVALATKTFGSFVSKIYKKD